MISSSVPWARAGLSPPLLAIGPRRGRLEAKRRTSRSCDLLRAGGERVAGRPEPQARSLQEPVGALVAELLCRPDQRAHGSEGKRSAHGDPADSEPGQL